MLIGYARISTDDQNLDLPRRALKAAGCTRIFEEKESGRAGTKRPAFQAALAYLREDDQLVVWKLDRLARSVAHLGTLLEALEGKGVHLRVLNLGVDTAAPTGGLMLNVLGGVVQFERAMR